ncbi:alpha-L-fucosidase, partial [bacterium]|nr:alpha-L-fucosidase [bacterium]
LVELVHKNQPHALVSGRAGHGLGDYQTLGDMEVPQHNVEGMWESVDTTNDSWAYAWYDENWKSPREILRRLISCVGRGGTYMLNIGPRGDGSVPQRAVTALSGAGEWIGRYPQVVYDAEASPWKHALPWGDVTRKGNTLFLCVFDWPADGRLYLPNLKTKIKSAALYNGDQTEAVKWESSENWTVIDLPPGAPEKLVSVIQVDLESEPDVDPIWAVAPNQTTEILAEFAEVSLATKDVKRWMEKFGEWKRVIRVHEFKEGGTAAWEVDVHKAGDYSVSLTYSGEGRLVWGVGVEGGQQIQNQQNSSHNYQSFPIGWLNFPEPGRYTVKVKCLEGEKETASLSAIHFEPR